MRIANVRHPLRFGSILVTLGATLALTACGSSDDAGPTEDEDTGIVEDSGVDTAVRPDTAEAGSDAKETGTDGGTDASEGGTDASEGGTDGGTDASETATDGGTDASETATDTADTGDTACAPLAATAVDVYVDKSSTRPSVGTLECPFHTIVEGTSLAAPASGTRTIHVKGGTGTTSVDYTETASVEVKNNVILDGDGSAVTKILGGGACAEGTGNCTVLVRGGGTIDGFTIGGTGVVTSATGKAVVKNVLVTGSTTDGIRALGDVDLGPNIQSNKNAANGLTASGTAKVHVIAGTGVINQFDENTGDGINIGGTDSVLTFDGGSASSNHGDGVDINNVPGATAAAHSITALVAKTNGFDGTTANGHNGIVVGASAGLKVRTSVILKNGGSGIVWTHSTSLKSLLDIGTGTDAGGNSLGGPTTADQNTKAGVCLITPGAMGADGNKWSTCPPIERSVSECTATFAYADIAYKSTTAVVITKTGCTVGP